FLRWSGATNMILANNAVYCAGRNALNASGIGGSTITARSNYLEGNLSGGSIDNLRFFNGGHRSLRTHKLEGTITYTLALRRKTTMSKRILSNSWPFLTALAAFVLWLLPTLASAQSIPASLGWYQIPNTNLRSVCAADHGFPQVAGN